MDTIRKTLSDITGTGDSDKRQRWHDATRFREEVIPLLPPSIEVVKLPPGAKHQFNCFAFAFNLLNIAKPFNDGFIYSPFIQKLMLEKKIVKTSIEPHESDIVLYWNNGELKHAGKITDDGLVLSKWSGGPILKHPLFHVPVDYGETIEYYEPISETEATSLFEQYKDFNLSPIL